MSHPRKGAAARIRLPRRIRPGTPRASAPGERLTCVVLAASEEEWVGVDVQSGAIVRSPAERASVFAPSAPLDIVRFPLAASDGPADPARPEAVLPAEAPVRTGRLGPRKARRLLDRLAAPERDGAPLLDAWGPSLAFVDLDGSRPSVVLVAVDRRSLRLERDRDRDQRAQVVLVWGGMPQRLPLRDPAALEHLGSLPRRLEGAKLEGALGFRPAYAVVALGTVDGGHARKELLALL